jgi:hypothetical protein
MRRLFYLAILIIIEMPIGAASVERGQELTLSCTANNISTVRGSYELVIRLVDGKWQLLVEPNVTSVFPVKKIKIDNARIFKKEFSDAPAILVGENWIDTEEGKYRVGVAADFEQDKIVDIVSSISIIPNDKNGGAMGYKLMQTNCRIKNGNFPAGSL